MKIIFCIPGNSFSRNFLLAWTELIASMQRHGHQILLSTNYDANIYYARLKCLGVDVLRGIDQKPFNGEIDYDFLMWIDSDVIFKPEDILKLINYNLDIVSGCYIMRDNVNYPIVEDLNYDYFLKHSSFQFINKDTLKQKRSLFEAAYVGFGFLCIKKGVFEAMKYPFFEPVRMIINDNIQDYASEDVSWCINIRKLGFKIMVDPTIIVGHEKTLILS